MDDAGCDLPPRDEPPVDVSPDTTCVEVETLERLHRGDVTSAEADRIREHLRGCPACRTVLDGIAGTIPTALAPVEPPPGMRTKGILDSILRAEPSVDRGPEKTPGIDGYDRFEEVGRGGMGVVWRAREFRLDRIVAVKVLPEVAALSPHARAVAETEARTLARISHPNIVRILTLADSAGTPAIVMEWIDGESLAARGAAGPFSVRQAARIVRDLAGAVAALHGSGIVHGDITPANVLLAEAPHGGTAVPKLIDFGLARGENGSTNAGSPGTAGTPAFMAPEQTGLDPALGGVGTQSDIHSLGALLYWLLSGSAPYAAPTSAASLERAARGEAPTITTLLPRLPPDLASIVATCLARRPEDRFREAGDLADDLERFLDGRPIRCRRAGLVDRTIKWTRRRPAMAALVVGAIATSVTSVFGVMHHVRKLGAANLAFATERDEAIAAAELARVSFARLSDSTAVRFLARGTALDPADREHLRQIRDGYLNWPLGPDAEAALHFRADGLFRTASLFDRLGWPDDAIETARLARHSIDDLDRLGIAGPEDLARRKGLMHAERFMLAKSGRLDEAIAATREALASLEMQQDVDPAVARDIAIAANDLGNFEGQAGRLPESRTAYERAIATLDRLVAAAPDDGGVACESLTILYNAAIGRAFESDPPARRRLLEKLVERATAGIDRFPAHAAESGRGLILGLAVLAHDDLQQGRAEEALSKVRIRAETARRLAAETPSRQGFRDEMIHAAIQECRCLESLGRPDEARAILEEAEAMATSAFDEEPAVMQRTWVLIDVLLAKAAFEEAHGSRSEAIHCFLRIAAAIRAWSPEGPLPGRFQVSEADALGEIQRLEAEERDHSDHSPSPPAEGRP